jgi:plasmid stabilization system protein ParE
MSRAIIISATALQEEAEAYLYYESQSEGLGEKFLEEIERTLQQVAENPTHYAFADTTKTIRDLALTTFPFVLIFEAFETKIIIYNIHHTKKNLK